ncbi:MAG: Ig-like domain-containing protein [Candidatus Cloacimonetes bacterium]|nr:Ig-like domain-containing protein [Candidatus Cloacimonadota bacterium]
MKKLFLLFSFYLLSLGLIGYDLLPGEFIVELPDGRIIIGYKEPSNPPPDVLMPAIDLPPKSRSITYLDDFPAFDWCYGCSATSAAMIAAYYDTHGYPNIYTGPTNSGNMPLTNAVWGYKECPLSATHQGYDGLATRGHVDDYWIESGNTGPDPYIVNGWTQHEWADCTADFMGTNQSVYGNSDGGTTFYNYGTGNPLYDYTGCEPDDIDGCHGFREFFESRGCSIETNGNFSQIIYGYPDTTPGLGFTFEQYKAEIDAGRPVMIHVIGHTMVGFGYNDTTEEIYIKDTWDHFNHKMDWGGSYHEMAQKSVSVFRLEPNADDLHVGQSQTYSTIAAAISDADDGDNVVIHAGTYYEHGLSIASKDIHISGSGRDEVFIDGNGASSYPADFVYIISGSSNVTISGVTIRNAACGAVYIPDDVGSNAALLTFTDCRILHTGSADTGRFMELNRGENLTITNNIFDGSGETRSYISCLTFPGSFQGDDGDIVINGNIFTGFDTNTVLVENYNTVSINAERNWWGDTDPSDNILESPGEVDYEPYFKDIDLSPVIVSHSFGLWDNESDWKYIDIEMIEGVYNTADGLGALQSSDFQLLFTKNSGTATGVTIWEVTTTSVTYLDGGESIIRCLLSIPVTPNGLETIEIKPSNGTSIYDCDGNAMSVSETTGAVFLDDLMPKFTELIVASNNASATVGFNSDMFTEWNDVGALSNSDFSCTITGGSATLSSFTIVHTAGNTTATINLSLGGGTPDGSEVLKVAPSGTNKIWNIVGYPMNSWEYIECNLFEKLGPAISSLYPPHGSTDAAVNTDLVMNFAENVQKGTGNINIYYSSPQSLLSTIDVNSDNVTINGAQLSIHLDSNLSMLTDYFILIDSGAIKDMTGDDYAGIDSSSGWNFTTNDDDPLPVSLTSFTSIFSNNQPLLQWTTLSEINNSGWNIYRNIEENINSSVMLNTQLVSGAGCTTELTSYQYIDEYDFVNGETYFYWLESVSYSGLTETYGPITLTIPEAGNNENPMIPLVYGLIGNYPNPFNPKTTLSFCLEEPCYVTIDIYNLKGQKIRNLFEDDIDGSNLDKVINITWDGNNLQGNQVATGIYLAVMKYGSKLEICKLMLLK